MKTYLCYRQVCDGVALFVAALLMISIGSTSAPADQPTHAKLDVELLRVLEEAGSDELIPVFAVLTDQLSGARLLAKAPADLDPKARRRAMIRALKDHAKQTQGPVLEMVNEAARDGRDRRIRPLWIGNIVAADLTKNEILRLSALDAVERIRWSPKVDISLGPKVCPAEPPVDPLAALMPSTWAPDNSDVTIECGVEVMRAPEVWNDLGNTGEGAVIAVIDSGVCWSHPDIENQIWVNPGEDLDGDGVVMDADDMNGIDDDGNGYVDDLIGYDIDNDDNDPNDDNSHGSHVAGTVAGDGTGGFQSGMAPDAKIMVIRVGLQFSDEPDVWEAMQYAADNGADSISMSLGWPHNQNPDRATWRQNCENTIDLGTAMVIAAGNEGSGNEPDNVRTPGDVPRVITVGATDCNDNIASFSSRGPVTWQDVPEYGDHPYPPGLIKPDVSAPGVSTQSHNLCSGYSTKSGTSMATPHVAGTVALMKSSNPGLTHDDLKFILEDSSIDLGDPGKDNVFGTGRVDAYEAVLLSASSDGRVSIKEQAAACLDVISLTVSDVDLKGSGTVDIDITSTTETSAEVVTLNETSASSGVFRGQIDVDDGPPAADGRIQVQEGDVITATYIDLDDGLGGTNVTKTDTADVDCTGPVISGIGEENITVDSADIVWTTDEKSDSEINYGTEVPPTINERRSGLVTSHRVRLTGLEECTVYYYDVASADSLDNASYDDNGGAYYKFETLADFGQGPQSCHAGEVTIDLNTYSCSDTLTFTVTDLDINLDSGAIDTSVVLVTSSTETQAELVTVTETDVNSSKFTGSIATAAGAAQADGILQIKNGDTLTVTYEDADDGTGSPAIAFDTAGADCNAPEYDGIRVLSLTDARSRIEWTTSEPATTVLEWGTTPALGQTFSDDTLVTSHSVQLNQSLACGRIYFRLRGTDTFGYESIEDENGEPFALQTYLIPGLYYQERFENGANGWTLEGEWETGAPQGLGGSTGRPDPASAYNNAGVLGHDLSGQGSFGGDYEPDTIESAWMPYQDATTWTNTKLILYRQIHSGSGDDASLWVWTDRGNPLYRSEKNLVNDSAYSVMTFDLSGLDGAPQMRLQFRQSSDASGSYSGWTVDDVIFKDGSLPDYASCSDCGTAPSFSGAVDAQDNDACGSDGVTISWKEAASWGSGGGGTYAVYRGNSATFVPGPANLIASGVNGLSYNDAAAPTDQDIFYVVRAESDENCGTGPANNGLLDDNDVHVAVTETTDQPTPGAIEDLMVTLIGKAHARLSWSATANAATYRIYRSETPSAAGTMIAETSDLLYDDLNVGGDKKNYFYDVRPTNGCGVEN